MNIYEVFTQEIKDAILFCPYSLKWVYMPTFDNVETEGLEGKVLVRSNADINDIWKSGHHAAIILFRDRWTDEKWISVYRLVHEHSLDVLEFRFELDDGPAYDTVEGFVFPFTDAEEATLFVLKHDEMYLRLSS